MQNSQQKLEFFRAEPKSRILCCHTVTAAKIIGCVELFCAGVNFIQAIVQAYIVSASQIIVSAGMLLFAIAVVAMMFYGIQKKQAAFIIPHLVFQAFDLFLTLMLIIACIGILANSKSLVDLLAKQEFFKEHPDQMKQYAIAMLSFCVVLFIFEIFFVYPIWLCYKYVHLKNARAIAFPPQPQQPLPPASTEAAAPTEVVPAPAFEMVQLE